MDLNTIAFFKMGDFSNINNKVLRELREKFSRYPFEVIDIWDFVIDQDEENFRRACCAEYGSGILSGGKTIYDYLFGTTYFFNLIRKKILSNYGDRQFLFTFQTQSLFDASIPGIPHFVYTDHTHLANRYYPDFKESDLNSKFWISLEKTIYQNASMVFTMSSNITRSLIEQYNINPEKIKLVYCGGNVVIPESKDLNLSKYSEKKILFVGVDWDRKGGPQLVNALNYVRETCPQAELIIVGCSPDIKIPNCKIVGKIPLSDVSQYYQNSSIFCLPTRKEPFGVVFIEAFTYRLPIIATDIGALPDIVSNGKNGYLIPPDDIKQLSNRIVELITDPQKCQLFGENGYQTVKDKYTWSNTGELISKYIIQFLD